MPYYRVTYEGYIEGEFDSTEEAETEFVVALIEDIEDGQNISIEKFDGKTGDME